MKNILIKVYAYFEPSSPALCKALEALSGQCIGEEENIDWSCTKNSIQIRFEGIFFPLDAVLSCLRENAPPEMEGKLDYIDIEKWGIVRHVAHGTNITISRANLNHVLDHSGF